MRFWVACKWHTTPLPPTPIHCHLKSLPTVKWFASWRKNILLDFLFFCLEESYARANLSYRFGPMATFFHFEKFQVTTFRYPSAIQRKRVILLLLFNCNVGFGFTTIHISSSPKCLLKAQLTVSYLESIQNVHTNPHHSRKSWIKWFKLLH